MKHSLNIARTIHCLESISQVKINDLGIDILLVLLRALYDCVLEFDNNEKALEDIKFLFDCY